jgi:drug/metabolite transporter, DME family
MSPPLLALAAATCFSISQIAIRLGTRRITPLAGFVLTLVSGVMVVGVVGWSQGFGRPSPTALLIFALAGLLGPGGARFLSIASVARIGATRTVPIVSAFHPMLSVTLGIVFLAESITLLKSLGIALAIGGILIAVRSSGTETNLVPGRNNGGLAMLVLPALAGAFYGLSDLARKGGMQVMPDPLTGSFIGLLVAAGLWLTISVSRGAFALPRGEVASGDIAWFVVSGIASATASVLLFSALVDGELSTVAPIVSLQPVLVAILAGIFLRRVERVSGLVAVAALLATLGTILIAR